MLVEKTQAKEVPLNQLVLHKSVQMREYLSQRAIEEYADAMEDGDVFPAIVAFGRTGGPLYVADGFHRVEAVKKLKRKTILAEVRDGGKREAMLYAMGANARHGVRRTNADKNRAVLACLSDRQWVKWADTEIAKHCSVSASMVCRLRERLGETAQRDVRTYFDRKGNLRTRTVEPREIESPDDNALRHKVNCCPYCGHELPASNN